MIKTKVNPLPVLAAIGVVTTTVLAIIAGKESVEIKMAYEKQRSEAIPKKASAEHLENEVVSEMFIASKKLERRTLCRLYLPTVLSAMGTLVCIFTNSKAKTTQLAITSAALSSSQMKLRKYRLATRKLFGDEADKSVVAEVAKEDYIVYPRLPANDNNSNTLLFYDFYSRRFFYADPARVREAIYHLNRNFTFRWTATPNELYEFIGIKKIAHGDEVGWHADWMMDYGYEGPWIDIDIIEKEIDGKNCMVLYFRDDPITEKEYEDLCT